jgi:hypothetical protein
MIEADQLNLKRFREQDGRTGRAGAEGACAGVWRRLSRRFVCGAGRV